MKLRSEISVKARAILAANTIFLGSFLPVCTAPTKPSCSVFKKLVTLSQTNLYGQQRTGCSTLSLETVVFKPGPISEWPFVESSFSLSDPILVAINQQQQEENQKNKKWSLFLFPLSFTWRRWICYYYFFVSFFFFKFSVGWFIAKIMRYLNSREAYLNTSRSRRRIAKDLVGTGGAGQATCRMLVENDVVLVFSVKITGRSNSILYFVRHQNESWPYKPKYQIENTLEKKWKSNFWTSSISLTSLVESWDSNQLTFI